MTTGSRPVHVNAITLPNQQSSSPLPSKKAAISTNGAPTWDTHITRLVPPAGQFVINTVLQIAGFVAAVAFGVYAVESLRVGKVGNQYAGDSTSFSILAFCLTTSNQVCLSYRVLTLY